jgi:hypothetical protein
MEQDEIIEMARQAGVKKATAPSGTVGDYFWGTPYQLEVFAKLVENKVTARYMQLFLDPENQPTQFGTATQEYREQEIKDEREACAKLMLDSQLGGIGVAIKAAYLIRARAQADRGTNE